MYKFVNLGKCTKKQFEALHAAFGGHVREVREHVGDHVYLMHYLDMHNGSELKWTGTDLYAIERG